MEKTEAIKKLQKQLNDISHRKDEVYQEYQKKKNAIIEEEKTIKVKIYDLYFTEKK